MSDKEMITGNKGEWSEYYVLLKVLGDGKLYGADAEVNPNPEIFYNINKVIRNEGNGILNYNVREFDKIIDVFRGSNHIASISMNDFVSEYEQLFIRINEGKGSFSIPEAIQFMNLIGCHKLKAPSTDKTDITIQIHEPKTGINVTQGFSIKSQIDTPSTLINASGSTNFIYELIGNVTDDVVDEVNELLMSKKHAKVRLITKLLEDNGITLKFKDTNNSALFNNLTLIDSNLPLIVAEMTRIYYCEGISELGLILEIINRNNPLNYRNNNDIPYYEYKVKKMLAAYALGMQSASLWNGVEEANGGYIIVKRNGDVVCYHIFDRPNFEEYLLRNTKMETPSTDRHKFGSIYKDGNEYCIKLNFQVRFID